MIIAIRCPGRGDVVDSAETERLYTKLDRIDSRVGHVASEIAVLTDRFRTVDLLRDKVDKIEHTYRERLDRLERWQWRVAGGATVLGALGGGPLYVALVGSGVGP
jgi:hypothetical protein